MAWEDGAMIMLPMSIWMPGLEPLMSIPPVSVFADPMLMPSIAIFIPPILVCNKAGSSQ
jgi:hypothetical protein